MIQRRAPLQRKTPLKRHKPLNRGTKPLRREGQRGKLKRLWRQLVRKQYFAKFGVDGYAQCQICTRLITEHTSDTHHKSKRSLGGEDEPENAVVLCRNCHQGIHQDAEKYLAVRDSPANVENGNEIEFKPTNNQP